MSSKNYFYAWFILIKYKLFSVNCEWSSWSGASSCSKSCGGGTQSETRHKTVKENHGGTCSGATDRKTDCNNQSCLGKF